MEAAADAQVTGESFDDDGKDKEPPTGGKELGPSTERKRLNTETASREQPPIKIAMIIQRVSLSCLSLMRRPRRLERFCVGLALLNFDGTDLTRVVRGIELSLVPTTTCAQSIQHATSS